MHNKLNIELMDLLDFVAIELIISDEHFTFIADYKYDHVNCPDCGNKTNKVHDRGDHMIQDIPYRNTKVYIKLTKNAIDAVIVGKEQYQSR